LSALILIAAPVASTIPSASCPQVDNILDNEQGDSIFAQQILSPGHAEAKQALEDIQDRHKDIMKLEKSIRYGTPRHETRWR
jgi:t-SNARE complex subunit (syntaxin)